MISNTRSKTVNKNITRQFRRQEKIISTCNFSCLLVFRLLIYILLFNQKKKQNDIATQIETTSFFKFFPPNIISIQHVLHFVVGRSQIEWKLKVKTLVFP